MIPMCVKCRILSVTYMQWLAVDTLPSPDNRHRRCSGLVDSFLRSRFNFKINFSRRHSATRRLNSEWEIWALDLWQRKWYRPHVEASGPGSHSARFDYICRIRLFVWIFNIILNAREKYCFSSLLSAVSTLRMYSPDIGDISGAARTTNILKRLLSFWRILHDKRRYLNHRKMFGEYFTLLRQAHMNRIDPPFTEFNQRCRTMFMLPINMQTAHQQYGNLRRTSALCPPSLKAELRIN